MIKKIRKKFKKVNSQKGFTLLEILVVLTIMGFLIAMVAPRLAGIGNDAVDTVCDTNQNRMVTYLSTYFQQTDGSLPNNLTNLVIQDGSAGTYHKPAVQVGETEGALSEEFNDRNHFVLHYLNKAEVAELADLGIDKVYNLNDYTGTDTTGWTKQGFMKSVDLDPSNPSAVPVLMTGIGADDTGAFATGVTTEEDWGEPRWFGRIILGMGSECDLITTGIISNAAHCPGGLQNEFATYNDYNLVVPRLAATADRIDTAGAITGISAGAGDGSATSIVAVAYDGSIDNSYDISGNSKGYKKRIFDLTKGQEGWEYETQCPEGHMYPEENDFWGIDLNDNNSIN